MHYIYTKEGIASAKGVDISSINKIEQKAEDKGYRPSKIIAGIKYYDFDELFMLNDPPIKKAIQKRRDAKKKSKQAAKRVQLSFHDLDYFLV